MTQQELHDQLKAALPQLLAGQHEIAVPIIKQWLDQSGLPLDQAFDTYNHTLADIIKDQPLH